MNENATQKIKTREINHAQHKRDIDKIQELIMLLQDLFFDNFALQTLADKLRTSRSSTNKYIWRTRGNMGQMIEGIVYIRFILKKITWKKKSVAITLRNQFTITVLYVLTNVVLSRFKIMITSFVLLLCIKFLPRFVDNEVHLNCLSPWNLKLTGVCCSQQ